MRDYVLMLLPNIQHGCEHCQIFFKQKANILKSRALFHVRFHVQEYTVTTTLSAELLVGFTIHMHILYLLLLVFFGH